MITATTAPVRTRAQTSRSQRPVATEMRTAPKISVIRPANNASPVMIA